MNTLPELIKQHGSQLPEEKREEIIANLRNLYDAIQASTEVAKGVTVTNEFDTENMAKARKVRLDIRRDRLEAVKALKGKREEVQRLKAVYDLEDKLYLKLTQATEAGLEPIEAELLKKENHAEIVAKERAEALHKERLEFLDREGLTMYMVGDTSNLSLLTQEMFDQAVDTARTVREVQEDKMRKAEQEKQDQDEYDAYAHSYRIATGKTLTLDMEYVLAMGENERRAYIQDNIPPKVAPVDEAKAAPVVAKKPVVAPVSEPLPITKSPDGVTVDYFRVMRERMPEAWPHAVRNGVEAMIGKMEDWVKSKGV